MPPLVRKLPVVLLALAAVVALAACGNKPKITTVGETEGSYLNVGPLTYQVQISRQLNPMDTEDRAYLQGLPPAEKTLGKNETFFGVFMRVANETDQAHVATTNFAIEDTQDDIYRPLRQSPFNPFAYKGGVIAANDLLPKPDAVAGEGVIQGSLVLFKLPLSALDNRPLELHITDRLDHSGSVKLDV
jgi:hypothetical protein